MYLKHKVSFIYSHVVNLLLFPFPDLPLIMRFRGFLYKPFLLHCGKNFQVSRSSTIKGLTFLSVGSDVYFAPGTVIIAGKSIKFEDQVMIGVNSVVVDGNHSLLNGSFRYGERKNKMVLIGKGSWVGANCTILPGSIVPNSSVVAANSSFNLQGSFPGIYSGCPASLAKKLFITDD